MEWMGKALYRKYRSRSLSEVVGQPQVTELLARALKQGRVAHAYLFTGPKGVGKTSIARILAHEINNLPYSDESTHLDIVEIDAASNNGVEDVRDLREKVRLAPTSAPKKVYIIDEVHMLSKPAFNALLKTLEEPPEHVVFILATTDVDKIPGTILSRTQRHNFRRASSADIVMNLQRIAKSEKVKVSDDALEIIARHSDGSFRDSVSLFDQLVSLADEKEGISKELVATSLGLAGEDHIHALVQASLAHDTPTIVATLHELEQTGTPTKTILHQLVEYIRANIIDQPELAVLLDKLLELHKSSTPDLKLLTTLSLFKFTPSPTKSSETASHRVSLSHAAGETLAADVPADLSASGSNADAPAGTNVTSLSHEGKSVVQPEFPSETGETLSVTPSGKDGVAGGSDLRDDRSGSEKNQEKQPKSSSKKPRKSAEFDWAKLLSHVKTHHVALNSVLEKCVPHFEENTLTLYTRNQFYKKKLDDSKYRALLMKSLAEVNMGEPEIETKPTTAPLKDSQAAKVAAMMGGGEEVKLEEENRG